MTLITLKHITVASCLLMALFAHRLNIATNRKYTDRFVSKRKNLLIYSIITSILLLFSYYYSKAKFADGAYNAINYIENRYDLSPKMPTDNNFWDSNNGKEV